MNNEVMEQILNKIKENKKIIISRHVRPDGDCVGSTIGLKQIIKDSFPDKEVFLINNDYANYLSFLGEEDSKRDASFYNDALIIIVDTSISSRISNELYKEAKEIIKIDHHIEKEPYGNINWVEDEKSSAAEMITEFYIKFKDELKLSISSATALYTGIITDSGRFKFSSANGETLRNASVLLDTGINTEKIFANLYLKDLSYYKLQSEVYKKVKMTPNGVSYIYINKRMQKRNNLSPEESSAMISAIDSIKGSIIWIAFIDNIDKSIRVRLRSRFVEINTIGEKYHGGGHAKASGAVVYNKKEMVKLLQDADSLIKEYKESNKEWL